VKLRAFTIIELLVVMLIISLLVAIGSIVLAQGRRSTRDARRISDVVSISESIDQAATANGGVYPRNVGPAQGGAGAQARMCVGELMTSGNPNNLNLSIFSNGAMPVDPLPELTGVTTGCTSYVQGYTFHTPRGNCAVGANSLAACQNVVYTLELGLENPHNPDDTLLKTPSALGVSASYILTTSSKRTEYLLNGKYCGTSCYSR